MILSQLMLEWLITVLPSDAGNAVFIALVLAGTVNKVESIGYVDGQGPQISEELDTLKYDSTCVNKDTGIDIRELA